jgi:hypothetical protein
VSEGGQKILSLDKPGTQQLDRPRSANPRVSLCANKGGAARHGHLTLTVRCLHSRTPLAREAQVFDPLVPGLAGRVSASGRKSFTLYSRHQGRMRRLGLGRYPDVLLERRRLATQHRGRTFDGGDPAGDRRAETAQNGHTVQALYGVYRAHQARTLCS